jgi:uncharacterized protein (DUF2461 family)
VPPKVPGQPAPPFGGFPSDTLRYLREIRENNEKGWFESHREKYERLYLAPARAFVTACSRHWSALAPLHRWLVDNLQLEA